MSRMPWKDLIRILVGIAVMAVLLATVDLRETLETLRGLTWAWIAALFAVSFALIAISCVKWSLFLRNRGFEVPFGRLLELYLIGYFFNNFTLGSVGGDFARAAILGRRMKSQTESFGSVFLERFTGFLALFLMALAGTALRPSLLTNLSMKLLMAGIALGFVFAVAAMAFPPAQRMVRALLDRFSRFRAAAKLGEFAEVLFHAHSNGGLLAKAMLLSVLFHLMTVVNTQAACLSLGIDADFLELVVVVPLFLLVAALPVSFNSVGIMETAIVYFLGLLGIPKPEALSVALILRFKNLSLAVLGGLLLVFVKRQFAGTEPDTGEVAA